VAVLAAKAVGGGTSARQRAGERLPAGMAAALVVVAARAVRDRSLAARGTGAA
jgi:hypothetical protein